MNLLKALLMIQELGTQVFKGEIHILLCHCGDEGFILRWQPG